MKKNILNIVLGICLFFSLGITVLAEGDEEADTDILTYESEEGIDTDTVENGIIYDNTAADRIDENTDAVDISDTDESYDFVDDPSLKRDTGSFYSEEYGDDENIGGDGIDLQSLNGLLNSGALVHQSRFNNVNKRVGIDVSEYQGVIDWNAVKNAGVEFAFIRVGYRGYYYAHLVEDKYFQLNLENARNAGIKVGLYFVTKAITTNEAQEEAQFVMNELNGATLDLPIFYDIEYDYDNDYPDRLLTANLSKQVQTDIANTFINTIKSYGYDSGVYASYNFFNGHLISESISNNGYIWMASYTDTTDWSGSMNFWQYTGTAKEITVSGINTAVDADIWYDDGTVFNKNVIPTVSMYRLYNPNSGEHFYTSSVEERNNLASLGWNYEGIGWKAPVTSNYPVYRLYNANGGEHHYTLSISERDMLVRAGWSDEGIGWYSADSNGVNSVPIYRQYNPNKFACNHNYTQSKEENDWLVSLGWKGEGISWYSIG